MKRYLLTLALIATTAFGALTLRADDTNATTAAAAPATPPPLPPPTLEQRLAALEAYVANTDPHAPLKDTNGNQVNANTPVIGSRRPRPQRLDDDLHGAGAVHDAARPGAVLRRPGPRARTCCPCWPNASCITGLVTILWWLCGYSLVLRPRAEPVIGAFLATYALLLNGVDSTPEHATIRALGFAQRLFHVSS